MVEVVLSILRGFPPLSPMMVFILGLLILIFYLTKVASFFLSWETLFSLSHSLTSLSLSLSLTQTHTHIYIYKISLIQT